MCCFNTSGYMDPAPIIPRPPALLTALANSHPLHQTIPAWMMGYWILNSWVIRFCIKVKLTVVKHASKRTTYFAYIDHQPQTRHG